MSRYWPGTLGPLGEVTHSELRFRKHQDITLCERESEGKGGTDLCIANRCSLAA